MKMIELPVIPVYDGQPVRFAQVKLNGWYIEIYRSPSPAAYFKGRTENVFDRLRPDIQDAVLRLDAGTILRGELHAPGLAATEVPRLLKSGDRRLTVTAFEVANMRCVSFERPRQRVESAGLSFVETIRISDVAAPIDPAEWFAAAKRRSIEGFVLKLRHGDDGYKLKPIKTIDAVVVDFCRSDAPAFRGGVKSFIVAVEGNVVASVGIGFSAEFRRTAAPEEYIGRVMEVAFQSVAARGRLESPRFERWRDDKPAYLCRLDQLAS